MHLEQLTINGFKSFAKKGDLEFSAPITAIVGPNGSGKSNVAEAFRFVLGEQSPSRLRSRKGEDMIWGGSDQLSRGNRASVSITLNNQNRLFPVDFDQVVLERTVHRDGQNDYAINGSKVRLKDVQETLGSAHIGPTGHHIISQGEADRILSAGRKERREMIEDALGLKSYQLKKAEAERKLEKTKANITQVESLRREVLPHLKFLEKQVKKIEKTARLKEELAALYVEYLYREDIYLKHNLDKVESVRQVPEAELKKISQALAKAKATLEKTEKDQQSKALLTAEQLLAEKRQAVQTLARESGQLEGQLSLLKRQIDDRQRQRDKQSTDQIPHQAVSNLVTGIEKEVSKVAGQENVSVLQRALTDTVHTLRQFLTKASWRGDGASDDIQSEYEKLLEQKTKLDQKVETASEAENQALNNYNEIKTTIEADRNQNREAEREIFRLVGEERDCETKLRELDHQLSELKREQEEFKRELREAAVLIGRAAADYQKAGAESVGKEVALSEDRAQQKERRRELEKLKIRVEEAGVGGEDVAKEYQEVKERDEFLEKEITDLEESVTKLNALIVDLEAELNERFKTGITKISNEFNRFFVLMFGGGKASLERTRPAVKRSQNTDEEVLEADAVEEKGEEGIEVAVSLPNKRVAGLDMLSGGERALTSIALIFAMSQINPPLFLILDETDAALDEANSRRYGDMIEALSKKSQLILITHNRETMSRAGILYGVTMGSDGVSKLLSVKLEEAVQVAK